MFSSFLFCLNCLDSKKFEGVLVPLQKPSPPLPTTKTRGKNRIVVKRNKPKASFNSLCSYSDLFCDIIRMSTLKNISNLYLLDVMIDLVGIV